MQAKVGDFAFALAPENLGGFLDRKLSSLVRNTALETQVQDQLGDAFWRTRMEKVLGVTIVGLDRNQGLITVDLNPSFVTIIDDLQLVGLIDLDHNVILDPIHQDFFTDKLLKALQAIGNPPVARNNPNPLIRRALGQIGRGARSTLHSPTADFLWNVSSMVNVNVPRDLDLVQAEVHDHLLVRQRALNDTQWQAWRDALTHRAWLVWGPPGTGKSTTVRAIMIGAVLEAYRSGRPLRVLLSASTYTAIDNVLLDVAEDLAMLLPGGCEVYRVRSRYQPAPGNIGHAIDVEINRWNPSEAMQNLRHCLQSATNRVVVGAPPEQVYNLLTCNNDSPQAPWFDLIVIDEASQMDVAHAVLPLCSVADGGTVILTGDPLQLPPIHHAEAPKNRENMVGSQVRQL
ncbi:MAG: AAA domain-containing protein [Candidatus Competibacteraceae bacterium]